MSLKYTLSYYTVYLVTALYVCISLKDLTESSQFFDTDYGKVIYVFIYNIANSYICFLSHFASYPSNFPFPLLK